MADLPARPGSVECATDADDRLLFEGTGHGREAIEKPSSLPMSPPVPHQRSG
jgi:hypothetical protein